MDYAVTTSNFTAEDVSDATYFLTKENERRAALDPPQPALPVGTNAEKKASLELLLATRVLPNAWAKVHQDALNAELENMSVVELYKTLDTSERAQVNALIASLAGN